MELIKGFTFDQETHVGKMDGVPWPSVTQLLQESKLIDYSSVPQDVLERKRILGTRVHVAAGILDEGAGALDEEHFNATFPECVPYLEAYRKFRIMEKFDPAPQKIGRLFSKKWRFHGEPDEHGLVLMRGPEAYLVDYKCTFKMFASTGPQLAGYQILLGEQKIKVKRRIGLLLKPNGNYEIHDFKDPNDRQDFLACLWLWWQRVDKYKTMNPEKRLLEALDGSA